MATLTPYRFDVRRFDKLVASGIFGDRKVELLNGIPIMMAPGPPHSGAVTVLGDRLEELLERKDWTIREEKPILFSNRWKPLPDLAVARGPSGDYMQKDPGATDIALLIEVADTTYAKDSGFNRRWYARFGIPAYWIVHINRRMVEVHAAGPGGLDPVQSYTEPEEIPLSLDGKHFGRVPVAGLFP